MSPDSPVTVTRRVDALLLLSEECDITLPAQLHYDAMDPYAVTATFLLADGLEVEWVLARDLLSDGLHRQTGEGDVVLRPSAGAVSTEVELVLTDPMSQARMTLPVETLADFLRASHHLVPPGTESEFLDLDTTILRLLST
jgi:hypothetical protein